MFGKYRKVMCDMIYYDFIREKYPEGEAGAYVSYGIVAIKISDNAKETICTVHDVFVNENKAKEFTCLCNKLNLSPVHIYDVIQDAIG